VGTTPLAGKLRLDMPLDQDLKRIFQTATDRTYREFLHVVAQSRGMTEQAVDQVARGRVWSGIQAKDRGLVDQTGTLQQAIDSAARIAGLGAGYHVEYNEAELSPIETFVLNLVGDRASRLGFTRQPDAWMKSSLFESLLNDLRLLASAGDGFTLAAHCLCSAP